jgi:uncharacterized protein YkwD
MWFRFANLLRRLQLSTCGATRRRATRSGRSQHRCFVEELEPRQLLSSSGFQPTDLEQAFLEDLNEARANPTAYGQSIGVDLSYIPASPPLAFSPQFIEAARLHSQDMHDRNYFSHDTPEGITPEQRVAAAGYPGHWIGECIDGGSFTPAEALASLIIDQDEPDLGHRNILLSNAQALGPVVLPQSQVGVGTAIDLPPQATAQDAYLTTIDTGVPSDNRPFITGVVFHDDNGNGKYYAGEGFSNVAITVQGVGTTPTFDSGGYSIQVNPGTYTVTASGGGLAAPITQTVTVGTGNIELDFVGKAEGSWSTEASLPTPRASLAVAASPGSKTIYALGGLNGDFSQPFATPQTLGTLEAYTPGRQRWNGET